MKNEYKNETEAYILMASMFGHPKQQISAPMDKERAEALASKITDSMEGLDPDFQVFKNVKVVKYTIEPMSTGLSTEKNDPYEYSVLDGLDKIIKSKK